MKINKLKKRKININRIFKKSNLNVILRNKKTIKNNLKLMNSIVK